MGTRGSAATRKNVAPEPPTHVAAWAALLAYALGVGAMVMGMVAGRPLGLRATLGLAEAALAAPGLLALLLWGIPIARGLALTRPTPRGWLFSVLAGAAFWLASVGLLELQYAVWAPPPGFLEGFKQLHEALKPGGPFDALLSIAAIALAPAVCEEILFRGIMLPAFVRPLGMWGAILSSAIAFGIIHADGLNLYRVPFAFAVALGLGVLRVRSGSLVPGLIAHAILNTTTFTAVLLGVDTEAPTEANVLQGAGLFVGGLVASALLLRRFPRRRDAPGDPARLDS